MKKGIKAMSDAKRLDEFTLKNLSNILLRMSYHFSLLMFGTTSSVQFSPMRSEAAEHPLNSYISSDA